MIDAGYDDDLLFYAPTAFSWMSWLALNDPDCAVEEKVLWCRHRYAYMYVDGMWWPGGMWVMAA